jgi:hypothetical protein
MTIGGSIGENMTEECKSHENRTLTKRFDEAIRIQLGVPPSRMLTVRNCSGRELMMGFSIDDTTLGPPTSAENTQTPSFDPTHLTA